MFLRRRALSMLSNCTPAHPVHSLQEISFHETGLWLIPPHIFIVPGCMWGLGLMSPHMFGTILIFPPIIFGLSWLLPTVLQASEQQIHHIGVASSSSVYCWVSNHTGIRKVKRAELGQPHPPIILVLSCPVLQERCVAKQLSAPWNLVPFKSQNVYWCKIPLLERWWATLKTSEKM